jgi:rSAM-associated Gly-rich repeat protein
MTVRSRTKQVLAMLLPAGVLGISAVLATMQAAASTTHLKADERISSVAERLSEIRAGVSAVTFKDGKNSGADAAKLGEWPNFGGGFGWRNGGWGNGGGWRNGGWGNGGWHNWGNGGWGNGGGWHNWHNFWHNW